MINSIKDIIDDVLVRLDEEVGIPNTENAHNLLS